MRIDAVVKLTISTVIAMMFWGSAANAGEKKKYTFEEVLQDKGVQRCLNGLIGPAKLVQTECINREIVNIAYGKGRIRNPEKAYGYAEAFCEGLGTAHIARSVGPCTIVKGYASGDWQYASPFPNWENAPKPSYEDMIRVAEFTLEKDIAPEGRAKFFADAKKRAKAHHLCMEQNDAKACEFVYRGTQYDFRGEILRSKTLDRKAAEHACNDLNYGKACYFLLQQIPEDSPKRKEYLKKSCEKGKVGAACHNYAVLIANESGGLTKETWGKVLPYYQKGCEYGVPNSCYMIAAYQFVTGGTKEKQEVKQTMAELCEEKGYKPACDFYNKKFSR